jgi:hypothetical protein
MHWMTNNIKNVYFQFSLADEAKRSFHQPNTLTFPHISSMCYANAFKLDSVMCKFYLYYAYPLSTHIIYLHTIVLPISEAW